MLEDLSELEKNLNVRKSLIEVIRLEYSVT